MVTVITQPPHWVHSSPRWHMTDMGHSYSILDHALSDKIYCIVLYLGSVSFVDCQKHQFSPCPMCMINVSALVREAIKKQRAFFFTFYKSTQGGGRLLRVKTHTTTSEEMFVIPSRVLTHKSYHLNVQNSMGWGLGVRREVKAPFG